MVDRAEKAKKQEKSVKMKRSGQSEIHTCTISNVPFTFAHGDHRTQNTASMSTKYQQYNVWLSKCNGEFLVMHSTMRLSNKWKIPHTSHLHICSGTHPSEVVLGNERLDDETIDGMW